MATVNIGNIKFTWKGAYNASTAYAIDDVVEYNGSSYIAKTATTGNLPTVTANWDLMSQAGTNGTNGTDLTSTLTTQGDILYRDGSGLQRLGAGTSGYFLKTQGSGANPIWAESSGGVNTPFFRAGVGGGSISSPTAGTAYKIPMNTEKFDIGGCFNNTNSTVTLNGISTPSYSFAPNVAGKYVLLAGIRVSEGNLNSSYMRIGIRKNGSTEEIYNGNDQDGAYYPNIQVHGIVEANGTSDYFHVEYNIRDNGYQIYDNDNTTFFSGFKLID